MNISDEELLYLVMCGSELAFYELYNLYYHLVWKTVNELVYKENCLIDVEDIVPTSGEERRGLLKKTKMNDIYEAAKPHEKNIRI